MTEGSSRKSSRFLRDFSYTFVANITSTVVSAVTILLLPKALGVDQYGYWQLYLLFMNYVSFLHLGLADGYYLKYAGIHEDEQDRPLFASLFIFLIALTLGLIVIVGLVVWRGHIFGDEPEKLYVLGMTFIGAILVVTRVFIQFGWQATNRFDKNAAVIILERVLFFIAVIIIVVMGVDDHRLVIELDLVVKAAALFISLALAFATFKQGFAPPRDTFAEAREDIIAGSKLMLASITSSLVIGVIQFTIQAQWSIGTYGKVALTLTLSNLFMVFINAVALVLLPQVRRMRDASSRATYASLTLVVVAVIIVALNVYYPVLVVAGKWLPQYQEGLRYMAILFPLTVFECKTALVTNTYLKAMRKESSLLTVNVVTLIVSVALSFVAAYLIHDLTLTVASILIVLAVRSLISEYLVSKALDTPIMVSFAIQIIMTIAFLVTQWVVAGWLGASIYLGITAFFFLLIKGRIGTSMKQLDEAVISA